jgi:hypothetical protein
MPTEKARRQAREAAREGRPPTTQAGAFVQEEMHKLKRGQGTARSRRQAVAIGLSEARREGVGLGPAKRGSEATRRKSVRDSEVGQGKRKPSPARSQAAKRAARARQRQNQART